MQIESKSSRKLQFARHLVGLVIVMGVLNPYLYIARDGSAVYWWLGASVAVVLAASVVLGLWALFFTSRSRGQELANYARLQWLFVILVLVGVWQPLIAKPVPRLETASIPQRDLKSPTHNEQELTPEKVPTPIESSATESLLQQKAREAVRQVHPDMDDYAHGGKHRDALLAWISTLPENRQQEIASSWDPLVVTSYLSEFKGRQSASSHPR